MTFTNLRKEQLDDLPTSKITSGTFADARIAESNVTQHQAAIDHDTLTNFASNEHFTQASITTTGTVTTGTWSSDLAADTVDAIGEIASALKSGADGTLITGTAGTNGDLAQWNVDGDLVDGPTPPSGTIVGTTDTQTLTNKTIGVSQITELSNLTADEGAQLENIGTNTISNAQWGYLGSADQGVATTDDVTFADITYTTAIGGVSALGNLGATETVDWATATHFTGTLDSDVTISFSNDTAGQKITLALAYDGTATRTITWPTIKWEGGSAPDEPTASGEELVVTLMKLGTTIYGSGAVFS